MKISRSLMAHSGAGVNGPSSPNANSESALRREKLHFLPEASVGASLARTLKLGEQPGARVSPVGIGSSRRNPQRFGGFLAREPGEVAEFHQFRHLGVGGCEFVQGFVEGEQVFGDFRASEK